MRTVINITRNIKVIVVALMVIVDPVQIKKNPNFKAQSFSYYLSWQRICPDETLITFSLSMQLRF